MQPRHYSQLYRQLRDLDPHDYHRVIRRYEEMEEDLGRLDALEHFEVTVYYVDALYATGTYRQHQLMVDLVIEAGMRENIHVVEGISGDIFQHLLFRKAAAAFRLRDFDTAIHVTRELVRIDPERELYVRFLRVALFKNERRLLQFGRASFIFCTLLTAFIITLNLLVITIFYPMYAGVANMLIGGIFVLGFAGLIGSYGFAYLRSDRRAYRFRDGKANK